MNLFSLSGLIIVITCISMSGWVFLANRKGSINKLWSLFCLFVSVWGFGCFAIGLQKSPDKALVFWRLTYASVIFIPVLFYNFVLVFLDLRHHTTLLAAYIATFVFEVANTTPLFMPGVSKMFDQFYYVTPPGIIYPFFVTFFVCMIVVSHVHLWQFTRNSQRESKKTQVRWFFMASTVGYIGAATCFLPVFGIKLYPYGNFTVPLYLLIMGYAIVRHRLMDIEVIIKKTLVFAGLFTVAYGVFAGFAYFGSLFLENFIQNRWIAMVPSIAVIVLLLRPLENFLRNITDRFLFQKKYDYRELLKTFTDEVLTVLKISNLVDLTVCKLMDIIRLNNAAIFLYDKDKDEFVMSSSVGLSSVGDGSRLSGFAPGRDDMSGSPIAYDNRVGSTLVRNDGSVFFGEVKKIGNYVLKGNLKDRSKNGAQVIIEKMDKIRSEMLILLYNNEGILGILSLGSKKSDEEFTQDDISIILSLAKTLSIAITNAQLLEKLIQAQDQAAQREKMAAVGMLAAGMAHEIKNPLTSIKTFTEYIDKKKDDPEFIDKFKSIVGGEIERINLIVKDLLEFAKPGKLKIKDTNINDVLEETISFLNNDLIKKGIKLHSDYGKIPLVKVDPSQMKQVFLNLFLNAIDAMPGGGVITVKTNIINPMNPTNSMKAINSHGVCVAISDTGCGISERDIKRVFDPFYTTKEEGKGTGLGLFIVKQIVERNDGQVSFVSEVGKGTEFRLLF